MYEIKPVVTETHKFENRHESNLVAYLQASDCQNSETGIKTKESSNKYTRLKFSIRTLLEKTKPAAMEKCEFEN